MRRKRSERGFTLLELLVALAIFAVLSVMAYGGLRSVLDTRERTDAEAERLAEIQTAMLLFGRDVRQVVARPIRDIYGDQQPPFRAVYSGNPRLELTRGGYRNPMEPARSALQRVGYALEEGVLYRVFWPVLDQGQDTEPDRMRLLGEVEELELRYLDAQGVWHDAWPPVDQGVGPAGLPRAVELGVDLEDWGRLTRLFALAGDPLNQPGLPPGAAPPAGGGSPEPGDSLGGPGETPQSTEEPGS